MLRRSSGMRAVRVLTVASLAAALPSVPAIAVSGAATVNLDWPQHLHDAQHSSVSPATAITTSNAASVHQTWHWQPPTVSGRPTPTLDASPTVVGGRVFIGSGSGRFYALSESAGTVEWHRQLDTEASQTCPARGITATAAVVPDPVTNTTIAYVSGARYLYALNAASGTQLWKTLIGPSQVPSPNAYYNWSSPTVAGGHIYVGVSSSCDKPMVRGGVVELDQHTGKVLNTWYDEPAGSIGGSVWATVAATATGSDVWVSTGNDCDPSVNTCPTGNQDGNSVSIVHLSSSLKFLQGWQATASLRHDWDFGSSPTLFGGTSSSPSNVGSCNKNGSFYAVTANPIGTAPVWTDPLGSASGTTGACLASAVWNAHSGTMFLASTPTTINGTTYGGSVRKVNPTDGSYLWQTGLPCAVMGTPSLDSARVLAVGTYYCTSPGTPGAYLVNALTGAVLATLPVASGKVYAQPVFAQSQLFVASESNGLYAFVP